MGEAADTLAAAVERARELLDPADLEAAIAYAERSRGRRGRATSGWDSLTPTELAVADLAAQDLTNPEIGVRLFVSRGGKGKTHFAHGYAKLQVTGQVELTCRHAAR